MDTCEERIQTAESSFNEKELTQKSDSSEGRPSKKIIKAVKSVSRKEIDGLQEKISEQLVKNKVRFNKTLCLNPYFSMKLFIPPVAELRSSDYNSVTVEAMLRRMDMLLQDSHLLEKEINKCEIRKLTSSHPTSKDLNENQSNVDHYIFLRRIWNHPYDHPNLNAQEKMDHLNKKVACIKNSIYSATQTEKHLYHFNSLHNNDSNYQHVLDKINQIVQNTQPFQKIQQKCSNYMLALQEYSQKYCMLQSLMQNKDNQNEQVIHQLKSQNDLLKKNIKNYKEKLLVCESKELELKERIKKLDEQLKRQNMVDLEQKMMMKKCEIERNQQQQKLLNAFDNIKFRKFSLLQNGSLTQERQDDNLQFKKIQTQQKSDALSSQKNQQKRLRTEVNEEEVSQQQLNQSMISQARSIDYKKNRFIRVRSPINGKLMKQKSQEIKLCESDKDKSYSPSLRQLKEQSFEIASLILAQK